MEFLQVKEFYSIASYIASILNHKDIDVNVDNISSTFDDLQNKSVRDTFGSTTVNIDENHVLYDNTGIYYYDHESRCNHIFTVMLFAFYFNIYAFHIHDLYIEVRNKMKKPLDYETFHEGFEDFFIRFKENM